MSDFILYRKPNETPIILNELSFNQEKSENQFIFHSFDNKTEWRFDIKSSEIINEENLNKLNISLFNEEKPNHILSKNEYLDLCNLFISKLKNKEFNKLILSRIKKVEAFNPVQKFIDLAKKYPNAFVYLFQYKEQTWLGATPERLLKVENNLLETIALAGTKSKSENRNWTEKEYEEHQFVVDYIVNSLSDLNLKIEPTKTIQLQNIEHLQTNISAEISTEINVFNLVKKLHPTPAVCGIPKSKAMDFIIKNEPHNRNFYTGFLGFETQNHTDFFVNLRCAQLFKDYTLLYVGGGITAKSIAENEWQETELKSMALV
ncbi:chorismate-binding protein [Weeksellaceae bacterium TAE3-ERU29]|nr:chorismate-binding protein [Weeksellaceae bacterium TAE3-ERU29]